MSALQRNPARGCCSAEQVELNKLLAGKLTRHRQQQPQQQLQPRARQQLQQHNRPSKVPRRSTRQEKPASRRQGKQLAVVQDLAPRPPSPQDTASISNGSGQPGFASQFDPSLMPIPPTYSINRMPDLSLVSSSPITNPVPMSQPASTSTQYPLQNCSPPLCDETLSRLGEEEATIANHLRLGQLEERSSPSKPIAVPFTAADGGQGSLNIIFDPKSQISLIRTSALCGLGYGLPHVNPPSSRTYKVLGNDVQANHYHALEMVWPCVLKFNKLTVEDADWLGEADGVFGKPVMKRILEKNPSVQESFDRICAETPLARTSSGRRPESQVSMDNINVWGGGTIGFQNDGSLSATCIEGASSAVFTEFPSHRVSYSEQPLDQPPSSVSLTDAPTLTDVVFQYDNALNFTGYLYGDQSTQVTDLSMFPSNTLVYYDPLMMGYTSFQWPDTETHYHEPAPMGTNLGMENPDSNPSW